MSAGHTLNVLPVSYLTNPANTPNDLWCINTSDLNGKRPRGTVLVEYTIGNSTQSESLILAPTWLPFNLLNVAPISSLRDSSSLINSIRNGLIKLIDSKDATRILETDDAKRERDRVAPLVEGIRNISNSGADGATEQLVLRTGYGPNVIPPVRDDDKMAESESGVVEWATQVVDKLRELSATGDKESVRKFVVDTCLSYPNTEHTRALSMLLAGTGHPACAYVDRAAGSEEPLTAKDLEEAGAEFDDLYLSRAI